MRKLLRFLTPEIIKARLRRIDSRLNNLEHALDALIKTQKYVSSSETGFNGQHFRKKIFQDILHTISFEAIVETGTYFGDTTGYMAETARLPVYTSEIDRRFSSIAKLRLADFKDIHYEVGDSRQFLEKLSQSRLVGKQVFFYLDAHWYQDLPLRDEVHIIMQHWPNSVIMIDDFKVPGDEGYLFDDYGKDKKLSLELIDGVIQQDNIVCYFPALPSREESGSRRGCVVLAKKGHLSEKLSNIQSVRTFASR
jgi:predicted O-methyltransferase YrrM